MKNLHTWRRSRLHWCTVWSGALSSVSCFPPRLLLFFLSAGFVFLVISASLCSLFFILSGFSPDFCLFVPLSFFLFVPLVFLWVFFLLFFLFFYFGFYCDFLLECFVSGVVAAEDGALELLLKMELWNWSCCWRRKRGRAAGIHKSPFLFFTYLPLRHGLSLAFMKPENAMRSPSKWNGLAGPLL